jgi:hypothetical protein
VEVQLGLRHAGDDLGCVHRRWCAPGDSDS